MRDHIQSIPDQAGRTFARKHVLFVLHVFTAFINNILLLRVRVPTFVTLASELATALACAAPLRPRHPTRSAREGDRRWQVLGLDHAPRVPRSAAGPRPHPGLPCRPRIIVTNLHLAEGLARKRNCCDADIALITGCLFIQLVSALTAILPQGAKLVFQLTAGAVAGSTGHGRRPRAQPPRGLAGAVGPNCEDQRGA
jgi:hypothetical protein